ncbi:DUF6313 family protein [Streptomyces sp. CA-111067]|uniref:DUF6313 family protein n=1 Tax=Streptomyces sp. CA-111067 TaxID=3240046 RepID=UPI003D988DE7
MAMAPQREPVRAWVRRTFRSRRSLSGLSQWVIDAGIPVSFVIILTWAWAAHSIGGGWHGGWLGTYESFTLIENPSHLSTWISSTIGWLIVPALIGGVAGHVIATRISRAKDATSVNLFKRRGFLRRISLPPRISLLRKLLSDAARKDFVIIFVRDAHSNDWGKAQDHWELMVSHLMSTGEFAKFYREECHGVAQDTIILTLLTPILRGICPVCRARP